MFKALIFSYCITCIYATTYSTVFTFVNADCTGNIIATGTTLNSALCSNSPCASGQRAVCTTTPPTIPSGHAVLSTFQTTGCTGNLPTFTESQTPGVCVALSTIFSQRFDMVNGGASLRIRLWSGTSCTGNPSGDATTSLGCNAQGASASRLAYVVGAAGSPLIVWAVLTCFAIFFL